MDQKYGYVYVRSNEKPSHPTPLLFSDMIQAIKSAMSVSLDYPDSCPLELKYFKVMNNKKILAKLHDECIPTSLMDDELYGFCILKLEAGLWVPHIFCDNFYNSISECVNCVLETDFDLPLITNSVKIAYFKLLSVDSVVTEIHSVFVKKQNLFIN